MAEIRPFRAVYYSESKVGDLSNVICPPYDIITPQMEDELYRRSPNNFIRIENNRVLPQDSENDNRYTRSAELLEKWLKQKVLVEASKPAIYVYDHYFRNKGKEYKRRGLIARVRLEEWSKNIVRPHEGTLAGAKKDRISLLGALKTNTSSIMTMYEDPNKRVISVIEDERLTIPLFKLNGEGVERHEIWQIIRVEAIKKICDSFSDQPLYIADGHHRYESALNFRHEQAAMSKNTTGEEAYNFVMMTLIDFNDPGLLILPPHRLLRGLPVTKITDLRNKLKSFFIAEELSLKLPDIWKRVDLWLNTGRETKLVIFGLDSQNLLLLTLRDAAIAEKLMPYFHSAIYTKMDVSIVDHIILEELLGLNSQDEVKISYNYDRQDAVEGVLSGEYQLAFIISPVKWKTIKAIADIGDRMPRKSTYFYPKLPSGLIINRLV
ncbi:DUF1015 domain-containing protein [Chloroflexota bacterium]